MPRNLHLRKPVEFRSVYANGQRYDGSWMTVFVLENELDHHRWGITASRKMAKIAVQRNRAKRLLREAIRLSAPEIGCLEGKYDWVLNARRSLLGVKVAAPLQELRQIITRVGKAEHLATDAGRIKER